MPWKLALTTIAVVSLTWQISFAVGGETWASRSRSGQISTQAAALELCMKSAVAAQLNRVDRMGDAKLENILNLHFASHGFEPVTSMTEGKLLSQYFGIVELDDFKSLPQQKRLSYLNAVFSEYSKIPLSLRQQLRNQNSRLDLVIGNVTSHPELSHLKNQTSRGNPSSKTYRNLVGVGGSFSNYAVVAADRLNSAYGTSNVILHELAHTIDQGYKISSSDEFSFLFKTTDWNEEEAKFEGRYPEEAFAESVALFYNSESTRRDLILHHPAIHDWIESRYGPPGPQPHASILKRFASSLGDWIRSRYHE